MTASPSLAAPSVFSLAVIGRALCVIGRHGPVILALCVLIGIFVPHIAIAAKPYMSVSVAVTVMGSLIGARFSVEKSWFEKYVIIVMIWAALGPTLIQALAVTGLAASNLNLAPELLTGMLLAGLAPPSGTAMTAATMLKLSPRLALISYVVGTLAAPLTMPILAQLFGQKIEIDTIQFGLRVLAVVGGGWLASLLIWQLRPSWLLPEAGAASGLSVLGLIGLCLGAMAPVRETLFRDPVSFGTLLAVALGLNIVLSLVGHVAFRALGAKDALTVGLLSGSRNVGLTVAAAGGSLAGAGEIFCAACLVPIFLMPFTVQRAQRLVALLSRRRTDRQAMVMWFPVAEPHIRQRMVVPRGVSLRIGRSIDADIRILDATVSREHARIQIENDKITFEDLDSSNGLYIRGKRVTDGELAFGDTLEIGKHGFRVMSVEPAS